MKVLFVEHVKHSAVCSSNPIEVWVDAVLEVVCVISADSVEIGAEQICAAHTDTHHHYTGCGKVLK